MIKTILEWSAVVVAAFVLLCLALWIAFRVMFGGKLD